MARIKMARRASAVFQPRVHPTRRAHARRALTDATAPRQPIDSLNAFNQRIQSWIAWYEWSFTMAFTFWASESFCHSCE